MNNEPVNNLVITGGENVKRKNILIPMILVIGMIVAAIVVILIRNSNQNRNMGSVVTSSSEYLYPVSGKSIIKEDRINTVFLHDEFDALNMLEFSDDQIEKLRTDLGEQEYKHSTFAQYTLYISTIPVPSDDGNTDTLYIKSDCDGGYEMTVNMADKSYTLNYLDDSQWNKKIDDYNNNAYVMNYFSDYLSASEDLPFEED